MAFTDYLENLILDHIFNGVTYTPPAQVYVVLFSVAPDDTGGGTEVTGGTYARQPLSTGAAADGAVSNDAAVDFTGMPAGDVAAVGLMDADTAGNLLSYQVFATAKTYTEGENVTIAVGNLTQTLD